MDWVLQKKTSLASMCWNFFESWTAKCQLWRINFVEIWYFFPFFSYLSHSKPFLISGIHSWRTKALCVSVVLKYPKKCLQHLTTLFSMSTWWVDCKKMLKNAKKIMVAFFLNHFYGFEMHMDRPDKSENIFGIGY